MLKNRKKGSFWKEEQENVEEWRNVIDNDEPSEVRHLLNASFLFGILKPGYTTSNNEVLKWKEIWTKGIWFAGIKQ